MANVIAARWRGDSIRMARAEHLVDLARTEMLGLLAEAEAEPLAPDLAKVQEVLAERACVCVRTMLIGQSNMDNLLAKSQASRRAIDRGNQKMRDIAPGVSGKVRSGIIVKIYSETKDATALIRDLSDWTQTYLEAAAEFAGENFRFSGGLGFPRSFSPII